MTSTTMRRMRTWLPTRRTRDRWTRDEANGPAIRGRDGHAQSARQPAPGCAERKAAPMGEARGPRLRDHLEYDPTKSGTQIVLLHAGAREFTRTRTFEFPAGVVSDTATATIRLCWEEGLRCFERGCFLAATVMCGRTADTFLAEEYRDAFGNHPSEVGTGRRSGPSSRLSRAAVCSLRTSRRISARSERREMARPIVRQAPRQRTSRSARSN